MSPTRRTTRRSAAAAAAQASPEPNPIPASSPPAPTPTSHVVRPKPGSYAKFLSIDVSSPLGKYICELTNSGCEEAEKIDISTLCFQAERKSALRSANGTGEGFPVSYRGQPRDRLAAKQDPHIYCFNKTQRAVRLRAIQTGLSAVTMQHMKKLQRKQLRVNVKKLRLHSLPVTTPFLLSKTWTEGTNGKAKVKWTLLPLLENGHGNGNVPAPLTSNNVTCVPKIIRNSNANLMSSRYQLKPVASSAIQVSDILFVNLIN